MSSTNDLPLRVMRITSQLWNRLSAELDPHQINLDIYADRTADDRAEITAASGDLILVLPFHRADRHWAAGYPLVTVNGRRRRIPRDMIVIEEFVRLVRIRSAHAPHGAAAAVTVLDDGGHMLHISRARI